jgi:F-type H+-transporting ATPase subunit delta
MTLSGVATRYANAFADVVTAKDSGVAPAEAVRQLRTFRDVVSSSRELHAVLVSPAVPSSRKRAVVDKLAGPLELSRLTRNFLWVLIDHRRIDLLHGIVERFEVVIDERMGYARAEVTSAAELKEEQRGSLTEQLERLTGKRIRSRFAVDPSLIGGVMARVGSTVYDGSVRGQLQALERRLSAGR